MISLQRRLEEVTRVLQATEVTTYPSAFHYNTASPLYRLVLSMRLPKP